MSPAQGQPVKLRLGVSLLYVSPQRVGGVAVFARGIVRELAERNAVDLVLFVPPRFAHYWRDVLDGCSCEMVLCGPDPDRLVARVLYEQTLLARRARERNVDVMFFPHTLAPAWRVPSSVVTIHDLLFMSGGVSGFSWLKRAYLSLTHRGIGRRAARIVTVSEFCRADIVRRLGIPAERVAVVGNAVERDFGTDGGEGTREVDGLHLPPRYVLSVGSVFPHKRLATVLEAFEGVAGDERDLHLLYAGTHIGPGELRETLHSRAATSVYAGRVHFLPALSRRALGDVYSRAQALISASEFEGFGIPIVEAMASRCPVAAAPAAAVVEVLGDTGYVADDLSADALAGSLRRALRAREEDPQRLDCASQRARTWYTWSRAASTLEEACMALPRAARGDLGRRSVSNSSHKRASTGVA